MTDIFEKPFIILNLYSDMMNMYADQGNVDVLKYRLSSFGFKTRVINHRLGQPISQNADFVIFGGGQDNEQSLIAAELAQNKEILKGMAEAGVSFLAICGAYQLLGKSVLLENGDAIEGVGVFDVETKATNKRLIGNIETSSPLFGKLIGYENHSGQTFLSEGQKPLADAVEKGAGNNASAKTEGAIYKNAIGTYLHGPFLPKNPQVADWLINRAVDRRFLADRDEEIHAVLQSNRLSEVGEITNSARRVHAGRGR